MASGSLFLRTPLPPVLPALYWLALGAFMCELESSPALRPGFCPLSAGRRPIGYCSEAWKKGDPSCLHLAMLLPVPGPKEMCGGDEGHITPALGGGSSPSV